MKRAVALFSFLACSGLLLADSPNPGRALREPVPLLEELARLTNAGFSDETVLAYAKAHRAEAPSLIAAEDLLWLRKSGVSETVIRYMTAIDVRASDQQGEEDVAYESAEAAGYPSAAYSHPAADSSYGYPEGDFSGAYPETYYADYYPFFGAGFYPYPVYFFVNNAGFFGRFHGRFRGHGFGRRHGDGVRRGGFGRPRSSDGFRGRRGGIIPGHRGPGHPGFPRRGFGSVAGPSRAPLMTPGRPARPAFSRGGPGPGFRAPQASAARVAPVRPSFAGGGSRGPALRSGGGPRVVGRAGGRGGR